MKVSPKALLAFMVQALRGVGIPEEDALTVGEVLIAADLRGIDSHGINRLKPIYIDRIREGIISPVTVVDVLREGPTTAVLDGNNGMGQVIAKKAMNLAMEKAKALGMGMVVVRNSNHYGIAGYYAHMATDAGLIGITGTNARPSIAPTGGLENLLGTNPLTIGIPSDEEFPFLIDCATSISQRGKIEALARKGLATPEGWVIGEDGRARTDTEAILVDLVKGKAALTPLGGIGEELGGHKGYGYATAVEILSSALASAPFMQALSGMGSDGEKVPYGLGHFFIAIDPGAFLPLEEFRKNVGEILRTLRASRKAPGTQRIFTAGEKEHLLLLERSRDGVPIPEGLMEEIRTLENWYGISSDWRS